MDFRYLGFWSGAIFRIFWGNLTKKGIKNQFQKIENFPQKKVKKCFRKNMTLKNSKKKMSQKSIHIKTTSFSKCFLRFLKNISGVVGCLTKEE